MASQNENKPIDAALDRLTKALQAEPVKDPKALKLHGLTLDLIKTCQEKIRLLHDFVAAFICEKSEHKFLTVYTDKDGNKHFLQHDKNFNTINTMFFDGLTAQGRIKTFRTKKGRS